MRVRTGCLFSFFAIVVLLFSGNISCFGASSQTVIKKYYKYLYRAEGAVVDGNYHLAEKYYDSSLKTGFTPVAVDVYNYARCAAYTNNFPVLRRLCGMLVLKGADIMFFQKGFLKDFMQSPDGRAFIEEFSALRTQYVARTEQPMIKNILELIAKDEALHHIPHNSPEEFNYFSIKDDSLAAAILSIMLSYDCFSEEVIGANFHDSTLVAWPLKDILFRHDMIKHTALISNAMQYAMKEGYIKPETGLQTLTFSNMAAYGFMTNYYISGDTLKMGIPPEYKEINSRFDLLSEKQFPAKTQLRDQIHLDEPKNIRKKILFCYRQFLAQTGRMPDASIPDFIFTVLPKQVFPGSVLEGTKEQVLDYVHPMR